MTEAFYRVVDPARRMGIRDIFEAVSRIPTASITQSGRATVKLGIDLGEVFSKAPEQANYFCKGRGPGYCSATSTLSPSHAQSEEANSLARRLPSRIRDSIYRGRI